MYSTASTHKYLSADLQLFFNVILENNDFVMYKFRFGENCELDINSKCLYDLFTMEISLDQKNN